jgi:hypothetical protein
MVWACFKNEQKKGSQKNMKLKGKSMRHRLRSGWKQQVRKGSYRQKEQYGRN